MDIDLTNLSLSDKPTKIRTKVSHDAQEHAHNISDWQQQYDQISAGSFYGYTTERAFHNLQIFKEHTSQSINQQCLVWPDSIWIGIPVPTGQRESTSRINGLTLGRNDVMCRLGNTQFELSTPSDFDIYGIVISQNELMNKANAQGLTLNWSDIHNNERLRIPDDTISSMSFLIERVLKSDKSKNKIPPDHLTQDLISMGLLEMLAKESPNNLIDNSYQNRKKIVDMARMYLDKNADQAITITQICEVCHTSRRTLQNSFESILGLSPIQYLRYTRLNGVRRDLKNAGVQDKVGDIAAKWGFWHLSQFAKDYKNVFGELPKQTLGLDSKY